MFRVNQWGQEFQNLQSDQSFASIAYSMATAEAFVAILLNAATVDLQLTPQQTARLINKDCPVYRYELEIFSIQSKLRVSKSQAKHVLDR